MAAAGVLGAARPWYNESGRGPRESCAGFLFPKSRWRVPSFFLCSFENEVVMSLFYQRAQTIAGFMRVAKVTVIRSPRFVLGRRKVAQLKSGRTYV